MLKKMLTFVLVMIKEILAHIDGTEKTEIVEQIFSACDKVVKEKGLSNIFTCANDSEDIAKEILGHVEMELIPNEPKSVEELSLYNVVMEDKEFLPLVVRMYVRQHI